MPLFYCIHCGQYIDADDEISGLEGQCPRCEGLITVPGTRRQLPQVVIQKLEPPAGSVPDFGTDPGPAFAVYEPVQEPPAEQGSASAPTTQGRRVVIKELPSGLAPMVPEHAGHEASTVLMPTERLEPPPSEPMSPPAPMVAEAKTEPAIPAAPPEPPAASASAEAPAPAALEAGPALDAKAGTDAKDSAEAASTSLPAPPAKPAEESSSPTPPAESPEPSTSSDPSPNEETSPKPRPAWKPRPYVEPESVEKILPPPPKRRAPFLPASAVGTAWLLGAALWQVGLMLAAGPDSLIREKCRDSMLFLFATFLASLVMVALVAAVFSFAVISILRMMKRSPFFGPVFCIVVMVLGVVFLALGLVWYQHGCPWLRGM